HPDGEGSRLPVQFAVGCSGAGDNQLHLWIVGKPAGEGLQGEGPAESEIHFPVRGPVEATDRAETNLNDVGVAHRPHDRFDPARPARVLGRRVNRRRGGELADGGQKKEQGVTSPTEAPLGAPLLPGVLGWKVPDGQGSCLSDGGLSKNLLPAGVTLCWSS